MQLCVLRLDVYLVVEGVSCFLVVACWGSLVDSVRVVQELQFRSVDKVLLQVP